MYSERCLPVTTFPLYYVSLPYTYENPLCNFQRISNFILLSSYSFLSSKSSIKISAFRYVYMGVPFKCFIDRSLNIFRTNVNKLLNYSKCYGLVVSILLHILVNRLSYLKLIVVYPFSELQRDYSLVWLRFRPSISTTHVWETGVGI